MDAVWKAEVAIGREQGVVAVAAVVVGEKGVASEEMATPGVQARQPQGVVAGPRPAPSYRMVSAVIEREDGPGPRCGHSLTAVAAVGEEGSPGYVGPRLILFGGATALEGNSSAAGGPQAASPGAGIPERRRKCSWLLNIP